jgi:signal peptidase I
MTSEVSSTSVNDNASDPASHYPPAGYSQLPPVPRSRRAWMIVLIVAGSCIGVLLLAVIVLRIFVFQAFSIPSNAMSPALRVGDTIVVNKLSYDFREVHRGDIVVVRTPSSEDYCGGPRPSYLVKRVIGLPGDTISLTAGAKRFVLIDNKRLAEPWLGPSALGSTFPGPSSVPSSLSRPYRVPANDYFLLGDNRTNSCDSRYWGSVPKSSLVGYVEFKSHL